MAAERNFETEQESFWAGAFGEEYAGRNRDELLLAANVAFFARALRAAGPLGSVVELGASVGMNLRALKVLYPAIQLTGVEINASAARDLASAIGPGNVLNTTLFDRTISTRADLALIKGVLIHVAPEKLSVAYDQLYRLSRNYILIAEYYNPSPVAISYRGHEGKLFKRDFAGELMDRHPDLRLLDYGFLYRRDPVFPQDDVTWFLMAKGA